MEGVMKRILEIGIIYLVTFVVTGCSVPPPKPNLAGSFPSQRLYRVESCDAQLGCGIFAEGSEFAIVKESSGDNWRLWQKRPSEVLSEVCTGTVSANEFSCDPWGSEETLKIVQANSSECGYGHCVTFEQAEKSGPDTGGGKGGHN
jgi:hypothetical protein